MRIRDGPIQPISLNTGKAPSVSPQGFLLVWFLPKSGSTMQVPVRLGARCYSPLKDGWFRRCPDACTDKKVCNLVLPLLGSNSRSCAQNLINIMGKCYTCIATMFTYFSSLFQSILCRGSRPLCLKSTFRLRATSKFTICTVRSTRCSYLIAGLSQLT